MIKRSITLAIGACVLLLLAAPSNAAKSDPCPGDDIVWIWGGKIYDRSRSAEHPAGHEDCLQHARDTGAHFAKRYKNHGPPKPALPPQTTARPPAGDSITISDSVYDHIDRHSHAERPDYGRYTYVLLTNPNARERNIALLGSVIQTTPEASSVDIDHKELNVFEIPEKTTFFQTSATEASAEATLASYDFGFAHDLIHKACATVKHPKFCDGDLAGPFLLTYGHALGAATVADPPYLVVDLHRLNAHGFDQMIALMKQQVKRSDYPDGRLVEGFSVRLLSFALDVSDWLPGLTSDTKSIMSLVPQH